MCIRDRSYTLCVSSAGMSRRLKRPEHFQAFMGQTVEVGFYKPMNGMKQILSLIHI